MEIHVAFWDNVDFDVIQIGQDQRLKLQLMVNEALYDPQSSLQFIERFESLGSGLDTNHLFYFGLDACPFNIELSLNLIHLAFEFLHFLNRLASVI